MTNEEREELIEKMAQAAWESDGTTWNKSNNILLLETYLREARAALAVAEPVIREQADIALREENARLREALDKCIKAMEFADDYFDGPVAVVQDAKDALRAAAAALKGDGG